MQRWHRGWRRHHRERMIRRALRSLVVRGWDGRAAREDALRWYDHLKKCSCYLCGNPRRYGAGATRQERRLLDAAQREWRDESQ
jgi:hypothetical protein